MKFIKGLYRDTHPADQPEHSWRGAKNLVWNEKKGALVNEPGVSDTSLFPEGFLPIGRAILPDDRIIVFLANGSGGSEIGIIQKTGLYETLVNDSRLDFQINRPIHATTRLTTRKTLSHQFPAPEEAAEIPEECLVGDEIDFTITPP